MPSNTRFSGDVADVTSAIDIDAGDGELGDVRGVELKHVVVGGQEVLRRDGRIAGVPGTGNRGGIARTRASPASPTSS